MSRQLATQRAAFEEDAARLAAFVDDPRLSDRARVRIDLVRMRLSHAPESIDPAELAALVRAAARCIALGGLADAEVTDLVLTMLGRGLGRGLVTT